MFKNRNPTLIWLKELRISIEVEYLNALQAKSVATTPTAFEALLIRDSQISIQRIRKISTQIIDNLDNLIDQMPITHNELKLIQNEFCQISSQIQQIVRICRPKFLRYSDHKNKVLDSVWRGSQQITKLIAFFVTNKSVNNSQLESTLRKLKENFGELVNHLIKNESKVIVTALYKKTGLVSVKWSLVSCCSLAQNDGYMCRLFVVFHKIVEPLIDIVINYVSDSLTERQQIKAMALRVLTILCANNRDAIQLLLQKCLYSQFLTTTLAVEPTDLIAQEAVELMAELSRFLIESNDNSLKPKHSNVLIDDFTQCLAKLMKITKNAKIFLLICSTLANISFVNNESIIRNDILNLMINLFDNCFGDIFIRDQMITIVANMAQKYPLEVVQSGGLVFILSSLQLKAEDFQQLEQLSALERIQQKVSVAIARLATNQSVTQVFFRLNVIQRLIQLCKEPEQRNFSQNVLIACIAALKRLANLHKMHPNTQHNQTFTN